MKRRPLFIINLLIFLGSIGVAVWAIVTKRNDQIFIISTFIFLASLLYLAVAVLSDTRRKPGIEMGAAVDEKK